MHRRHARPAMADVATVLPAGLHWTALVLAVRQAGELIIAIRGFLHDA